MPKNELTQIWNSAFRLHATYGRDLPQLYELVVQLSDEKIPIEIAAGIYQIMLNAVGAYLYGEEYDELWEFAD